MSVGVVIRARRLARGWSQQELAEELGKAADNSMAVPTQPTIARWELGRVVPGTRWLRVLASVLDVPLPVLRGEATLSHMDRRSFVSLTALATVHGKAASEMVCSMAGGDAGPLATVQTTHDTDLVIAAMADRATVRQLRQWMTDGSEPVLRVNAAGILAKRPGQAMAVDVARVLTHDHDVRTLYSTAVVARIGSVSWAFARRFVANPLAEPDRAAYMARRLTDELSNPRDAGARWCAAGMLRDLSPLLGR